MNNVARRRAAAQKVAKSAPPAWMVDGAVVNYHGVIGEPPTKTGLTVRGEPFKSAAGYWVVFLNGHPGYVACEAVSRG